MFIPSNIFFTNDKLPRKNINISRAGGSYERKYKKLLTKTNCRLVIIAKVDSYLSLPQSQRGTSPTTATTRTYLVKRSDETLNQKTQTNCIQATNIQVISRRSFLLNNTTYVTLYFCVLFYSHIFRCVCYRCELCSWIMSKTDREYSAPPTSILYCT